MADFNVEMLLEASARSVTLYEELNRFPSVERDLAVILDEAISYDEIHRVAIQAGGAWLTDLHVFDIYANPEHVGRGRKSVALRMTIENKTATLTDKDLDQWFSKIQKAFVSELKAEIRK
jgi:phenylalanyl-tRNA synthetase beta chain